MIESAAVAALFVFIHVSAGRWRFPRAIPRSVWMSAAGGVSVAYVFLHLLPELHAGQHLLQAASGRSAMGAEQGIYLVALAGFVAFYGLERLACRSRAASRAGGAGDQTERPAFALHVGAFALYNLVVGYLLLQGERDNVPAYAAAMALHFLVNDHALREHHKQRYDALGRWVLAAAVLVGWSAGLGVVLPEAVVRVMTAVLAGGVILNVIKEELPQERGSRFTAFLGGAALLGVLLLAV